ncbi:MAG TPA: hypothetical protein VM757_01710 [Sphingomicrobium sp.]|nr:hypothetical protein [Sphingomicrobium sp.]
MRHLFPIAVLIVSACAPRPAVQTTPTQPVRPIQQSPEFRSDLIGMTASELGQRLGRPELQVREGAGLKLQFRGACILDAYLYPPEDGRGPERVTHVDTRLVSGADTDQANCIRSLAGA